VNVAPARIEPLRVPRIWGVRSLDPLYDDTPPFSPLIGEVWLSGEACRFATGPFASQTLGEAWPQMPAEWTGTRFTRGNYRVQRIPLLAKYIFPGDKLSIQVHPDDAYAQQHERAAGGVGKTEMWYVAAAAAKANVRVGLAPNVTRDAFNRAIENDAIENCLESIVVHAGDVIFVPAGTAHMIGPGMVLYEMQQHSDLTYRVFDYNRFGADGKARELHLEKAMGVMHFGSYAPDETVPGRVEPMTLDGGPDAERILLVACRYFAVERWHFEKSVTIETSSEQFELLTPLVGTGRIAAPSGLVSSEPARRGAPTLDPTAPHDEFTYAPGQSWFVPAALGKYSFEPAEPTTLLRAYVPNLEALERETAVSRAGHSARPQTTQL
jgi:mannose-6-phosphate isomerase